MRKTFISLIALIMTLIIGTCDAATYTLPEKMKNQLGRGVKKDLLVINSGMIYDGDDKYQKEEITWKPDLMYPGN